MTRTITFDWFRLLDVSTRYAHGISVSMLHINDIKTYSNMQESIYAATALSPVIAQTLDNVTLHKACCWPDDRSFRS